MSIAAFLSTAVGPLAKRVLVALGFGVVSYVGVSSTVDATLTWARDAFNGLPADLLAYLAYAGVPEALSITAGAISARAALHIVKRLSMV